MNYLTCLVPVSNSNPVYIRKDIEGLRALAVGLVVLFHAGFSGLSGGYVGVDIFFVISGYIITSRMLAEHTTSGTLSLKNFWASRVRRLLPLSSITVLACFLIGLYALDDARIPLLKTEAIAASSFWANILFVVRGGGYLTGLHPESPLLHYWSLAVEEQFYLVWPLVFVLIAKKATNLKKTLYITCLTGVAASLLLSVIITPIDKGAAYYLLPTRAWELLAGCAMGVLSLRTVLFSKFLPYVGAALIAYSALVFDGDTLFPSYIACVPVVGTLLILSGRVHKYSIGSLLSNRALVWIGGRSYAIYLFHWPLMKLWEGKYGEQTLKVNLIISAFSVALAALSYRTLEGRVRHSVKLATRPVYSIALGLGLVSVSLLAASIPYSEATGRDLAGLVNTVVIPNNLTDVVQTPKEVPATAQSAPLNILLVGDSVLASVRWYEQSQIALEGFTVTLDAESCRRLSKKSCRGREGRTPETIKEAISGYNGSDFNAILILGGYHSTRSDIAKEFKDAITMAQKQGFNKILWVNFKESLSFPLTGSNGKKSAYSVLNTIVTDTVKENKMNEVKILDWNIYSSGKNNWFIKDGIHTTLEGTLALGRFISLSVRDATCIGTCAPLARMPAGSSFLNFYKVPNSTTHCYAYGKNRKKVCETDKALNK